MHRLCSAREWTLNLSTSQNSDSAMQALPGAPVSHVCVTHNTAQGEGLEP